MAGTKQLFTRDDKGKFTFQDFSSTELSEGTQEDVLAAIDKLLKKKDRPKDPKKSLKWFRAIINQYGLTTQTSAFKTFPTIAHPFVGSMFFYHYNPKHAKTLPFYDSFPLVIVLNTTEDGWFGLNLHYLNPIDRAHLFYALLKISTDKRLTQRSKLKLTYKFLKSLASFYLAKPCLKRYLVSHVDSKFIRIDPKYWELALFMPVESFKKKNKTTVWGISKRS